MVFLRTLLRSHRFHALSKHQNPSQTLRNPPHNASPHFIFSNSHESSSLSSIFRRSISLSAQFEQKIDTEIESINSDNYIAKSRKKKKPLDVLFKEAVGLSEKLEHSESESESGNEELKKKLRKLEAEVRSLKENRENERENLKKNKKKTKRENVDSKDESNPRSLYALFTDNAAEIRNKKLEKKSLKVEEPMVYKELSSDMAFFANHLYRQGYFKDANFLPRNRFDVTCFENNYGRDFIKFAAEKFGKDNQEIAKWLSGSDLKKVALFGCPSLAKKNIFSAKTLRTFFKIQEDTVCTKCVLKQSCKFVNQSVWKGNTKTLDLAVVMRVITLYALESVPPQLVVPDEIKASVSRLIKEVLNLSETVS